MIKGARQVGKTTLIGKLLEDKENILWVDGDDPDDRAYWDNVGKNTLFSLVQGFDYVVVDEAQRIVNVGLAVKMIVDGPLNVKVIVTGSSSLDLASSINEPLTGRKWSFDLYPISWGELVMSVRLPEALRQLDQRLIYGSYPDVITAEGKIQDRLKEITTSYLYKDILEHGDIRKPEVIANLLRALSYQVGNLVSYHELGKLLYLDSATVRRYIDLLEESYVLIRLPPLSRNRRKEISTSRKIYFVDNGVRNAMINQLMPMSFRNDHGQLWENFIVSEFYKLAANTERWGSFYFWRSKNGSEVDLIFEENGRRYAFEIKYNPRKRGSFPPTFRETHDPTTMETINRENFYELLRLPNLQE
ncbi:MAG: ATP-binding protein [Bacteroidota bacterium]